MIKFLKKSSTWALSVITIIFTFVPEMIFEKYQFLSNVSTETNVILNRVITFVCVFILSIIINALYSCFRNSICIVGNNYSITIKYGDLLKINNCKKVISFDECFTTVIGELPSNVKSSSICGQYLKENPIQNMQVLIDNAQLKPSKSKSKYKKKERYESGKLVPNGEYLLMAFAKLDEDGSGKFFSREEFLNCLSMLWKEINKYYGQSNVCIPILGSGITRMEGSAGASLTQQELLDMIIWSYRLSPYKIKDPYELYVVCKRCKNFSINKIDGKV